MAPSMLITLMVWEAPEEVARGDKRVRAVRGVAPVVVAAPPLYRRFSLPLESSVAL